MAISNEQVLHVADLASLALTEAEVERLGGQLSAILEAVGKVSELDLEGVEPLSHPLDVVNVWDEDSARPSLPPADVFANAPAEEDSHFRVPPSGAPPAGAA